MIKRPLCAAAVLFAAVLWLLGKAGIPFLVYAPPHLPPGGEKDTATVTGILYKKENYTYTSNLYLKKANLILNSKIYPIDNIKIKTDAKKAEAIEHGSLIASKGSLEQIPLPSNPGQFNERAYSYARKVKWFQESKKVWTVQKEKDKLLALKNHIKTEIEQGIRRAFSDDIEGIITGMLLGDKSSVEQEDKQLFQIMGISHILAISGLHLSVLGGGLFLILRKIHIPIKIAGVLTILSMFFYGGITGSSAAVIRAAVMFSVSIGGLLLGRTYDFLSAISLSAILLLAECPLYLYDSSFLLSFGAVLGLGIVYPALFPLKKEKQKQRFLRKLWHQCRAGLQSGISIWLVHLPLMMYFFYEIPLWGILINLLVIPTVGILLISGLAGGVLGMTPLWLLGKAAALPGELLLGLYMQIGMLMRKFPETMCITGKPEIWKCVLYYVFLGVLLAVKKKGKKYILGRAALFLIGVGILCTRYERGQAEVIFLDVGQGDCSYVQNEERNCYLIDGGSTDISNVGKYRILPCLKAKGVQTVSGVFMSHMDQDHINGITQLLEMIDKRETALKVEKLFLSKSTEAQKEIKNLENLAKKAGCEIFYIRAGTTITDGKMKIQVLAPQKENLEKNAGSQVLSLTYGETDILFTGDVEGKGEEELIVYMKEKEMPSYELLKVAHHGSKNSTTEKFLQKVRPGAAIISCGRNNSYGHPHKELVQRLEEQKIKMFMTMDCGAILVVSDGKSTKVSFQHQGIMVE